MDRTGDDEEPVQGVPGGVNFLSFPHRSYLCLGITVETPAGAGAAPLVQLERPNKGEGGGTVPGRVVSENPSH